ncbi:MAG: hypothetical protein CM15mP77_4530 [Synechococcus sp.]|nr:MAG: hypothetical protein CM15mP77_4530 [Synechococcus sp.]
MHGTAYANFAVTECDLLIAVGHGSMTASPESWTPSPPGPGGAVRDRSGGDRQEPPGDVAVLGDLGLSLARMVEISLQRTAEPRTGPGWSASTLEGPLSPHNSSHEGAIYPRRCCWR